MSVKSSRNEDEIRLESHQAGKYLISVWGGFIGVIRGEDGSKEESNEGRKKVIRDRRK